MSSYVDPVHPVPSAQPETPPNAQSGRNARGQFAPGNPGGPGRPPKVEYIEREVVAIMASALTAETWFEIAEAVIKKAREGNMTAVQWLSRTFLTGKLNEAAAAAEVMVPVNVEMFELGKKQHRAWSHYVERKKRKHEKAQSSGQPTLASQQQAPPTHAATPTESRQRVAAGAGLSRIVPETDRVRGFRVTKGVSPANGPNRANTEENAGPPGPCAAS